MAETSEATRKFAALVEGLTQEPGVSQSERRGFGYGGLMVDNKLFAILKDDRILVKLPARTVSDFVLAGAAEQTERNGKLMKEWVFVEDHPAHDWLDIVQQAKRFVASRN